MIVGPVRTWPECRSGRVPDVIELSVVVFRNPRNSKSPLRNAFVGPLAAYVGCWPTPRIPMKSHSFECPARIGEKILISIL